MYPIMIEITFRLIAVFIFGILPMLKSQPHYKQSKLAAMEKKQKPFCLKSDFASNALFRISVEPPRPLTKDPSWGRSENLKKPPIL